MSETPRPVIAGVPSDPADLRRLMAKAVLAEASARACLITEPSYPVGAGSRIQRKPCVYRFSTPERARVHQHDFLMLLVGGRAETAMVRVVDERHIEILTRDLGPRLDSASLVCDMSWLYHRLHTRLLISPLANHLVEGMFWPRKGSHSGSSGSLPWGFEDLSEEKARALTKIATIDLAFIWGPPGTGKTFLLAAVAAAAYATGDRALVVAPTNSAADAPASQIAERLRRTGYSPGGTVTRVGEGSELTGADADLLRYERIIDGIDTVYAGRIAALSSDPEPSGLGPTEGALRAEWRAIRGAVLADCRLVVTTVHQCYLNEAMAGLRFDVVMVDEVAQMLLPMAYFVASLADRRIVLAGDFMQLAPPVKAQGPDRDWLGTDIFHAAGVARGLLGDVEQPHLVSLWEQSRMDHAINDLASAFAYGDRLHPSSAVRQRDAFPSTLGKSSVYWIDSSRLNAGPCEQSGAAGRVNEPHCLVVEQILATFFDYPWEPLPSVAVLTPFRAQEHLLRSRLGPYAGLITVSTVHRFQSREADLVLLDLPEHRGQASKFMRACRYTDQGARLITVALSRARRQLVVIADFEFLQSRATPKDAVVRTFLGMLIEHGSPLPPSAYIQTKAVANR
jgi:hypothetical protein